MNMQIFAKKNQFWISERNYNNVGRKQSLFYNFLNFESVCFGVDFIHSVFYHPWRISCDLLLQVTQGLTTSQFATAPKRFVLCTPMARRLTTSQIATVPKRNTNEYDHQSGLTTSQIATAPKRPSGPRCLGPCLTTSQIATAPKREHAFVSARFSLTTSQIATAPKRAMRIASLQ